MVASVKGEVLPRMGLGMAALGRPGYINLDRSGVFGNGVERTIDVMQTQSNTVLDALFKVTSSSSSSSSSSASAMKMPWLDCARSYGLSEKFVGEYLRSNKISKDDVYVSSKWGYTYVADWNVQLDKGMPHEVKDHSVENFLKQIQETEQFIGEYVKLYQIHSATFESGVLTDERVHQALSECRNKRGWSIGLSVSGPKQDEIIAEAMKVKSYNDEGKVTDMPLFDSVQCTFNALEQRPGPALLKAHNSGMDIIIKEGLANGRIFHSPSIIKYSKELNVKPDQLALGCILAQPFQPRVLSGAVEPWQLESNFQATNVCNTLKENPALFQDIMNSCVINSEEYWSERSALAWN